MGAFPMPNDPFGTSIVVASVHVTDDIALVLLLNPTIPFFTVCEVAWFPHDRPTHYVVGTATHHMNIVQAVRDYENNGGDI